MKPIWRVLLGLYMLIVGAIAVLSLTFDGLPTIMGIFAIVIGILILLDR